MAMLVGPILPGEETQGPALGTATCTALVVLLRLDHYTISLDRICRLCFAQRSDVAFMRSEDLASCFSAIGHSLADVARADYKLLVDTRVAPGRNDPSFEALAAQHRGKLLMGFARNAALASSAAGRLQIQRYAKADRRAVFATDDPEAAFAYLGLAAHRL
jgi:hypothetical protein